MNTPKLRFKEFNEEWKKNTLSYMLDNGMIMEHIDGNHGELYPRSEEFVDIGVPYISANSLLNGNVNYSKVKYLTPERAKQFKKGVCMPDDLLFAHNATVGPVGIVDDKYPLSIISTTLTLYRINKEFLNNIFIKVFMESFAFIKQYSSVMKQSTRNQVPITMQRNFYFPTIDLEEQNKIASFFKLMDKKIQLQKEKIDLLNEQKKGYMQKIFNQELRFKDDKGKPFPDWKNTTLGEITEIIGGGTPSTDNQEFWIEEVPWFTPSEIGKNKYVSKSNRMISHKGLQKSSAKLLPKGTVLLTTRASLGDMAILKVEASTNQGFQSLLPLENTSSEFIYYLQPLIKKYCYLKASGSTFLEISKHNLKAMRLKLPSKDEQDKIVAFLSGLDRKIVQEQKIFYLLNSQKQAFMQQMFI